MHTNKSTQAELPLPKMRVPVVHVPAVRVPQPDGAILFRPGKPIIMGDEDEITTAEAAVIIGVSCRRVQQMCDQGELREGIDWRRPAPRNGRRPGFYKIKRSAAIEISGRQME